MQPIPILLLARELGIGGSERQLTEIAKNLDRRQFEVHVARFLPGGFLADELAAAGVRLHTLPVRSLYKPSVLAGIRAFRQLLRRERIQLVHPFDIPTTVFAVPLARMFGVPAVLSSQRGDRALIPQPHLGGVQLGDRFMHATVVNCQFLGRLLQEKAGIHKDKIHLCYNGVDSVRYSPSACPSPHRQMPFLRGASIVIGATAAYRAEKGLPVLLDAFARFAKTKAGARLVIVGDGPLRPALEKRVVELNLQSSVLLEPPASDVAGWLRAFDIFILPSISEALSNSLMEAMACGCAVVATDVGGNPELVQHGKTGLLVPPGDSEALASAMRTLCASQELRAYLSAAARESIVASFTIEKSAAAMGAIYRQMLAAKGAR